MHRSARVSIRRPALWGVVATAASNHDVSCNGQEESQLKDKMGTARLQCVCSAECQDPSSPGKDGG